MSSTTHQDQVVLTTAEAAKFLRLHPQTLWKLRDEGEGPPWVPIGRRRLYLRDDLITWLKDHRKGQINV